MAPTRRPLRILAPGPARPLPPAGVPGVRRLDTLDPGLNKRKELYRSGEWRNARSAFLRTHPTCENPTGCANPSTVVDHVDGHSGDWEAKFWDHSRWQALCTTCHNAKTATEHAASSRPLPLRGHHRGEQ